MEKRIATAAVDALVVLMRSNGDHRLLLIKRVEGGTWAMPGGRLEEGETASEATLRELQEECGIDIMLEGFEEIGQYVLDGIGRDPRGPVISVARVYAKHEWANSMTPLPHIQAGDDAKEAHWVSISDLASVEFNWDFFADHGSFIEEKIGEAYFNYHNENYSTDAELLEPLFGPMRALLKFRIEANPNVLTLSDFLE